MKQQKYWGSDEDNFTPTPAHIAIALLLAFAYTILFNLIIK